MPMRAQFETESQWLDHLRLWLFEQLLDGLHTVELPEWAYAAADAMLVERVKEPKP